MLLIFLFKIDTNYIFAIVQHLGDAGVSEECQLEDHGLVIAYIGKKLCVGRILAKYQKISDRHSYVRSGVNSVDSLSFISVILYRHLSGSYFTCQSPTGGNLFVYLSFKNVVYYLGKASSFNITNYEMLTLDISDSKIFSFFQQQEVIEILKTIYN